MYEFSSEAPIQMREQRYSRLFDGELMYINPSQAQVDLGMSALARTTNRAGARPPELSEHLDTLPLIIDNILERHDLDAFGWPPYELDGGSANALFGFVSPEGQEIVTGIVADIFRQWEITRSRHGLQPLATEGDSDARWLVVETAAAVMYCAANSSNFNLIKNRSDRESIAKIITCWGPKFAEKWFDGTILSNWAAQNNMTEEELEHWRATFSPSTLKHLADTNTSDPLGALEKIKHHLEVTLTDQNIAKHLGWSRTQVSETFSASERMKFAVHNRANPIGALKQVKDHLEMTLTDESLAQYLGWEEAKVRQVFTAYTRKCLAISYRNDPLSACKAWASGKIKITATNDSTRDNKLSGNGYTKLDDYMVAV